MDHILVLFFFGFLLAFLLPAILIKLCLHYTGINWRSQKAIFVVLGSLLACPVLVPAATIMAIPMPNIVFLTLVTYFEGIEGLSDIPFWLTKIWQFTLVSLIITTLIYWLLAKLAFFKNSLPKQAKKPI